MNGVPYNNTNAKVQIKNELLQNYYFLQPKLVYRI